MPSRNGSNGRDSSGRFTSGNPGGPGNPHGRKVARLRAAMLSAISAEDVEAIITQLVESARDGDIAAAREVLDRTLGKAAQSELIQRVEELEARITEAIKP